MPISPDVHIVTNDEMIKIKQRAFRRGVERGYFERGMEEPFTDAMQIIKLGCSLFFGRSGDGTHMDDDTYRQAHTEWFIKASDFVRAQEATASQAKGTTEDEG